MAPTWMDEDAFHRRIRGLDDTAWLDLLQKSVADHVVGDVVMPSFPPDALQVGIHGHSGLHSIREAWKYYVEVRDYAAFCEHPAGPDRRLLDFGCGWGRVLRPWMRDLRPRDVVGAEPNPRLVVTARTHNPYVGFVQPGYLPPLPLSDASIDYVIAWSVFSHLDPFAAEKWFAEFRRILRPGGLIAVTTQGLGFLDACELVRSRKAAGEPMAHPWHEALARSFLDVADCRRRHAAGEALFAATTAAPPRPGARYGETILSPGFVRSTLAAGMDVIDHVDAPERLPQALIVLQKPR